MSKPSFGNSTIPTKIKIYRQTSFMALSAAISGWDGARELIAGHGHMLVELPPAIFERDLPSEVIASKV